jgi:hypothetical protein
VLNNQGDGARSHRIPMPQMIAPPRVGREKELGR